MPRFSVIVPAHQVQEYLEECLDSVLAQSCDDFELIAVDDCSPDACGDLIDEYAARDPRVRPLHLTANGGPGNARNAGMERARGDYLLFLDGDDALAPGALQSVSDRLKECDSPDVLLFGHTRTFWNGESVRDRFAGELHEQGPASFTLAERPGLLRVPAVAWNKAYSREFVEHQGFTFPPGHYEGTPWTYSVLMSAATVSTLDEVCVLHRQRRHGSAPAAALLPHLDIFGQYDRVFSLLDSRPDAARWRPVVHHLMLDHFAAVLDGAGRLPRGARAEFFRRARAHCRRLRAAGTTGPRATGRLRGIAARGAATRKAAREAARGVTTARRAPATAPGATPAGRAYDAAAADAAALRAATTHAPALNTPDVLGTPGAPGTSGTLGVPGGPEALDTWDGTPSAPYLPRPVTPSLRTRLRHTLLVLGSHRTYHALALLRTLRRSAAGRAGGVLRTARAAAMRLHYRIQLRLPVRADQAVFAAYGDRGYACNPAAIEAKVRELAPHVRTSWIAAPAHQHTVPTGTRRLRPGSAAYWSALARAKYLVTNDSFDHRLTKRPSQVLLQTQHGTPLKTMGLDLQDRPAAAMDFAQLLANTDMWDYLLSANRHSSLVWGRAYPSPYTTLETGYPRNDVFQSATAGDVARIRASLNIPEGSTAVLYAPTHRDYRRTQRPALDLEHLARSLGPRHVILTRAHHLANGPLHRASSHSSARIVDVSEHHSIESLCLASDTLITDYSSLMFDYANLDRPIVLHIDDREAYEAARGTYFDIREFPPGAIARTEDELVDIFRTGHWRGSRSAQLRAAFRARFCPYDDGRAAERVVRRVFLGQSELPRVVPLEERTPTPAQGTPAGISSVLPAQQDPRGAAQDAGAAGQAPCDLLRAGLH
ncbi:CDP-glycerol glycerophosphotransferase family protein [Streptomyces sp. NPDC058657]|uniref:CDP-glycerol glycerophosphotransferase family protein n=1 Tax=unclassified Streptomyces TaxID=2593676 RepID=UPI003667EEDE